MTHSKGYTRRQCRYLTPKSSEKQLLRDRGWGSAEHLDASSEWGCRIGRHHSNQEWMCGVELGQTGGIIRCLDGLILITFASLLHSGSSGAPCKLSPKSTSGLWGNAGLNSSFMWHDQSPPEAEMRLSISNSQSFFSCFYAFSELQKWKINKQISHQLFLHRITTFLANGFCPPS